MATATKKKLVGVYVKRSNKSKAAETPPDSEALIRQEVANLAERLKRICRKPERAGEIIATAEQDEVLREAAALDAHAADLAKQFESLKEQRSALLAPLIRHLDARGKYALVGTLYQVRAEAYEASISVKLAGTSHRLRPVRSQTKRHHQAPAFDGGTGRVVRTLAESL